jgi:DNA-binding transcriptional LysR family regulator
MAETVRCWMNVDFRQLEIFVAVMDCGSVTKAADSINLSPGAVSLQLHGLASEIRTELFVRSGKRLVPTPAAVRLSEQARRVLRQVREIQQEFESDPNVDTRPFHFATGATTLIHRLGRPLRLLRKQFPKMQIQVTVSATEEMVSGLQDRRFDLALISLPCNTEHLRVLPLFDEELLILRPSPKRVGGWHVGNIAPEEFAGASFLLYPKRSNMRAIIDDFFRTVNVEPNVIMEADDTEAIKRLVESGFGYSILPEFALRAQPRSYQALRVSGHRMFRSQALAMVRTEYPRALIDAVASFLKNALAEQHPEFSRAERTV